MTDTPETDGEWNRLACQDHPEFERNLADFARKMERERDEALGLVDRQAALLKRTCEALAEWKDATAEQRDEAFLKTMNLWKP